MAKTHMFKAVNTALCGARSPKLRFAPLGARHVTTCARCLKQRAFVDDVLRRVDRVLGRS